MKNNQLGIIDKTYVGILLVIFGGIVVHAPLSVWLGSLLPDYELLFKSWKEILMLIAGAFLLIILYQKKQFKLVRDPLIVAIGVYALLHILTLFIFHNGLLPSLAGLMIDLRYLLFFCLVYFAMRLYPSKRKIFFQVAVGGAFLVLTFALLQVFILPDDILKYIGYGKDTISPYLTVDENQNFIRINSTLRGPNPLGAYAVIVFAFLASLVANGKINLLINKKKWSTLLVVLLSVGAIVTLWFSYSRSAFLATMIAVATVFIIVYHRRLPKRFWATLGVIIVLISGAMWFVKDNNFVSNVLLHENPADINDVNSNDGHLKSLTHGINSMIIQPLGAGIGSTGSASLYSDSPMVIENQYLFIAHEVGWFGLLLFMSIFFALLIKLWDKRQDWLVLGVLASGIGLALIGLLLPVWVDDTVSIIWWGLVALALFSKKEVI